MSDLRKSALNFSQKKPVLPSSVIKHDFAPIKWQKYFDKEEFIKTASGEHHIYIKGHEGPIILCLHGGGYNGLTWSLFAKELYANLECQIVAIDFRGHGNTKTLDDSDLSLETMTQDVADIANILAEREKTAVVLIGHSMGGAVAVNASYNISNLAGLCVIDVVEGTALDALSSMQSILRGRPSHFKSIPHAIQWCYKGGQCHNLEAARVSMPGQIVNIKTGQLACDEWETFDKIDGMNLPTASVSQLRASKFTLREEDEEGSDTEKPDEENIFKIPKSNVHIGDDAGSHPSYSWKIDLSKTEPFWQHWFQNLSDKFLNAKVPRILVLANIHGLDTKLTVGQMQGKFQLQVLAKCGHAVQEDQPHHVAEILSIYLVKQKCAEAKSGFSMPLYPNTNC
ncbi:unnamed protein product [Ceutorhynchus assimilis]|uniref:Protein phosphatase methylesterase 1 n=1 Tax=Ceutorhynchus assimilis TaxID=467358 RepID=A0A9N9QQW1_9CUCU|nr:unnamed protein product [Ceutorhynchus assimilis]